MVQAPPLKLTEPPDNTAEECDAAIGAYLRAWDQVEHTFLPLFGKMLGTHQTATMTLLRVGMNQPTLRSILESLAPIRLKKSDQRELAALLRRWETASSKRNRIVHGNWMLGVTMIPGPSGKLDHTKSRGFVCIIRPTRSLIEQIHGPKPNQKVVATYKFRLKDLAQFTEDVRKLARDMRAFVEQLSVIPFVNYQPIDIDQSAIP